MKDDVVLNFGDFVQLKSGGPKMVVEKKSLSYGPIACCWFAMRAELLQRDNFERDTLIKWDDAPK